MNICEMVVVVVFPPPVGGVGVTVTVTAGVGVRSGFALEACTGVVGIAIPLRSKMARKSIIRMRIRSLFIGPSKRVGRYGFL